MESYEVAQSSRRPSKSGCVHRVLHAYRITHVAARVDSEFRSFVGDESQRVSGARKEHRRKKLLQRRMDTTFSEVRRGALNSVELAARLRDRMHASERERQMTR